MNPINFVYWLQGFLEIGDPKSLNEVQIQEIRNHISLVLTKITPYTSIQDGKLCEAAETLSQANFSVNDTKKTISSLASNYPLNGCITDMNGNPFPNDFLVFTHEGSC